MDTQQLIRLRWWNIALAVLHAAQAAAIIALANGITIGLTSTYPAGPPGSHPPQPAHVADVSVAALVALFLVLAAIDHALAGTVLRRRYDADLQRGINRLRWIEYAFSATIMIVLIGFYFGLTDMTVVVGIIGANVAMILFGWLQEVMNPPDRTATTMLPFWFGTVAGAAPWVAITINFIGSEGSPGFVVGIYVSLFIFFSSFAVNQWLQYRRIGPWRDYLFGERAYLALSLVAKSALAWQIFGGSLAT